MVVEAENRYIHIQTTKHSKETKNHYFSTTVKLQSTIDTLFFFLDYVAQSFECCKLEWKRSTGSEGLELPLEREGTDVEQAGRFVASRPSIVGITRPSP